MELLSYCEHPFQHTAKKVLQKQYADYAYDKWKDVRVIRWMDNAEVTIVTNYDAMAMVTVQRYSREKKKLLVFNSPLESTITANIRAAGMDIHDNGVGGGRFGSNIWTAQL